MAQCIATHATLIVRRQPFWHVACNLPSAQINESKRKREGEEEEEEEETVDFTRRESPSRVTYPGGHWWSFTSLASCPILAQLTQALNHT